MTPNDSTEPIAPAILGAGNDISPTEPPSTKVPPWRIFIAFSRMALSGFGGVMPFAYRGLVENMRWVEPTEFAELLAIGQVLPGPTICNLSVMVGWRKGGPAGAAAALAGMMVGPMAIVLMLWVAYERFGVLPWVHAALLGMSAVAAGLVLATAAKMGASLFQRDRAHNLEKALEIAFVTLAFAGVGIAHLPLILVVGVLGPIALAIAWWTDR